MSIGIGGIIGAILGFLFTRSIFGSLIGYFIGSSFDRVKVKSSGSYEQFRDRFNRAQYAEDYYTSRLLSGVDFRAKNLESFDSLENNSVDLYASVRSLY